MAQGRECATCGTTQLPPRQEPGRPPVTCSQECRELRAKSERKRRYAENREQAIADAVAWREANGGRAAETYRRWRAANADRIRESKRAYAEANREAVAARQAAWYVANRERIRAEWAASQTPEDRAAAAERTRQWAKANPERRAELRRQWAKANREKAAIRGQRRRALMRGQPADNVSLRELLEAQGFMCALCDDLIDSQVKYPDPMCGTVDHIVSLARHGNSLRPNLQAAHMRCNSRKGAA